MPTSVFPNVGDAGEINARVIAFSGLIEENAKLELIIIRVRRMLVMITFFRVITWVTSLDGTNHVFMEQLISILYELEIRISIKRSISHVKTCSVQFGHSNSFLKVKLL